MSHWEKPNHLRHPPPPTQKKKKNKKKTDELRDIRLMFLSRSTEKQAGHNGETVAID